MKKWMVLTLVIMCLAQPVLTLAKAFENRNASETQESLNEKYGFQIWMLPEGIEVSDIRYWAVVDTRYDGAPEEMTETMLNLFEIDPGAAEKRVSDDYGNSGYHDTEYLQDGRSLEYAEEWNGYRYVKNVVGIDENADWSKVTKIGIMPEESLSFAREEIARLFGADYALHPLPFNAHLGESPERVLTGDKLKELYGHDHFFDVYYEGLPVMPALFAPAIWVSIGRLVSGALYIERLHYGVGTYRGDETIAPPEHVLSAAEAMDLVIDVRKKYCTGADGYEVREGEALGFVRAVYTNFWGGDIFRPAWCFMRAGGSDIFVDMASGEVYFDR